MIYLSFTIEIVNFNTISLTHFVTTTLDIAQQVYYRIHWEKRTGVPILIDSTVGFERQKKKG